MAVAVAVSGGVAVPVAVPVAVQVTGLTKKYLNQKDFLINVWGYVIFASTMQSCISGLASFRLKSKVP